MNFKIEGHFETCAHPSHTYINVSQLKVFSKPQTHSNPNRLHVSKHVVLRSNNADLKNFSNEIY